MLDRHLSNSREGFPELLDRLQDAEGYEVDALKVELCEQLYLIMEREAVTKAELARRLDTSRAYTTKLLQGSANFTLESLVKVAKALDCKVSVKLRSKAGEEFSSIWDAKKITSSVTEMVMQRRREECRFAGFGGPGSTAKRYTKDPRQIISTTKPSSKVLKFVAKAA